MLGKFNKFSVTIDYDNKTGNYSGLVIHLIPKDYNSGHFEVLKKLEGFKSKKDLYDEAVRIYNTTIKS